MKTCVVGMDIGAGSGAKIGAFDARLNLLAETFLPVTRYGGSTPAMAGALAGAVRALLSPPGSEPLELKALGLAAPGLFASNGTFLVTANLPFLKDSNLRDRLAAELRVPVAIMNDADAGAIAEWSRCHREMLYWVFGGGWGGAWVSAAGDVRFSSVDWNGRDESLHYTNEPGYAIPLPRDLVNGILKDAGTSLDAFERTCTDNLHMARSLLAGPGGPQHDTVRAELLVSGHGQWRLLRTMINADPAFAAILQPSERAALESAPTAGRFLDEMAEKRQGVALRTMEVFGRCLGEAADVLFRQAVRDGCPADIPIFLSGRPSQALPFFGPIAHRIMRERGIQSVMTPSTFGLATGNPNMVGGAALALRQIPPSRPPEA